MTDYVVDRGVLRLFEQVDEAAPSRDRSSDGTKGDLAHQLRVSQHNPESPPPPGNPDNQVDAGDFTHDPRSGADMAVVSESIRQSRDRRVRYVIFNQRIFSSYSVPGRSAWTWGTYSGDDPHDGHMHLSVNDEHHDETQDWQIGIGMNFNQDKVLSAVFNLAETVMLDTDRAIDGKGTLREFPVPITATINGLVKDVAEVRKSLADAGPVEITLSTEQLAQLGDYVVARLGALRFTGRE